MSAEDWTGVGNLLCIRPDNIGDVLMSEPAIRALKRTFGCRVTLLTSAGAQAVVPLLECVDEAIPYDVPWVKHDDYAAGERFFETMAILRQKQFDAAVVFTVFSQNPLPSAMLAYLAGIPRRLAYVRENPYALITHWVPDREPYDLIKHQVRRDLDLVGAVGATVSDEKIRMLGNTDARQRAISKLESRGLDLQKPWLVMHPGVSEKKRQYPADRWIALGNKIVSELDFQVVITGSAGEKALVEPIASAIPRNAFACAGLLTLEEFAAVIRLTSLVISVNTATIHIAAATQTPVVVLYALTNPQHLPWQSKGLLFPFTVPDALQSKNEVLRHLTRACFPLEIPLPAPGEIVAAISKIFQSGAFPAFPEVITPELLLEPREAKVF